MEKKTQTDQIFDHLSAGHSLTPQQALQMFGCFRLAAIVHRLRKRGYEILNLTPDGKHATYRATDFVCPPSYANRKPIRA